MDISESPTQANDDRDYETARHHELDADPEPVTSSFHDEPHTLLDDDTGAVVFGSLSQDGKIPSPLSDNLSPVDVTARNGWRESQDDVGVTPARQVVAPPQTPAPVSNPFLRQGHTSVLRATQLFNATQLSSAGKGFSPTSSRPSPHAFHQGFGFLNSTSPAQLETSPLKIRFAASSPLRVEGASSGPPGERSQGEQGDEDAVESIPESPTEDEYPPRKRRRQELLEDYEPLAASQQRKLLNESLNGAVDSDDSDGDEEFQRRLQAKRSRERAERRLVGISLDLPRRSERSSRRAATQLTPTGRLSKRWRGYGRGPSVSPRAAELVNIGADAVSDDDMPPTQVPEHSGPVDAPLPQEHLVEGDGLVEGIPGTSSPPLITADRVVSQQKGEELPDTASSNLAPALIPQSSQRMRHKRSQSGNAIPESPIAVPESDYTQGVPASDATRRSSPEQLNGTDETPRLPPDPPTTQPPTQSPTQPPSPPFKPEAQPERSSPKPKTTIHDGRSAVQPNISPPASPASSSSQLTVLSSTPSPIASPETKPSPEVDWYASSAAFELPAPRTTHRPVKTTYSRALRKSLPRSLRSRESLKSDADADAGSSDELTKTPVRKPRASRSRCRGSLMPESPDELQGFTPSRYAQINALQLRINGSRGAGGALFENMAFAISFQERRDGESAEEYDQRCRASEDLAALVASAGGRVLRHGFSELLDPSEAGPGVELRHEAREVGFTALLADGHSRKVKFMQALALGLPCLAYQWATASLERGEVQEWGSYLLCAGQSVPRGNALLSRTLVPYPAETARLEDVVAGRKLLLGGQRILLVMKAREGEGMAYVVLARIVGAEITRVRSVREGRKALRKGGFEWVYGDEGGSLMEGQGQVRCLSNELIIQSLIAGRVIDEGERAAFRI